VAASGDGGGAGDVNESRATGSACASCGPAAPTIIGEGAAPLPPSLGSHSTVAENVSRNSGVAVLSKTGPTATLAGDASKVDDDTGELRISTGPDLGRVKNHNAPTTPTASRPTNRVMADQFNTNPDRNMITIAAKPSAASSRSFSFTSVPLLSTRHGAATPPEEIHR
jgi:hypothetical protein